MDEPKDTIQIADDETRVVTHVVTWRPSTAKPLKVVDSSGRIIGAAAVSWTADGLKMEFFIDPHTPEGFDIEVATGKAKITPLLALDSDGFDGVIVIE